MTTGLSRSFSNIMMGNLFGEPIRSYPHEVRAVLQLHFGDPGADLDRNVIPRSERGCQLIAADPTGGRIVVDPPQTWTMDNIEPGVLRPVYFSILLDGQALFGSALHASGAPTEKTRVMWGDTLSLPDSVLTWTVGTI
jgi:hypothetical protein